MQEGINFEHALPENFLAGSARDAFHRAVPRDKAKTAIKREDTIDARVDEAGQQKWGNGFHGLRWGLYWCNPWLTSLSIALLPYCRGRGGSIPVKPASPRSRLRRLRSAFLQQTPVFHASRQ